MEDISLWGLFLSSFISSTLMPGGSEVLLAYLLTQPEFSSIELLVAAAVGNSLGGILTYGMGWWLGFRWPLRVPKKKSQQRAMVLIQQYGAVSLFFSWVPFIGDPLCLVAGWIRCNLFYSILLICLGKLMRYLLIVLVFG